jgi:hypothetical protein
MIFQVLHLRMQVCGQRTMVYPDVKTKNDQHEERAQRERQTQITEHNGRQQVFDSLEPDEAAHYYKMQSIVANFSSLLEPYHIP